MNNIFVLDPNLVDATLISVMTAMAMNAVSLMAHSGISFGRASAFVAWNITRQRYSLVSFRFVLVLSLERREVTRREWGRKWEGKGRGRWDVPKDE